MLDFLTFSLCVPYSETTDGKDFDNLLEMVAARGRGLFRLFQVNFGCSEKNSLKRSHLTLIFIFLAYVFGCS